MLTADLVSRVNEDKDHRLPRTITIHHRHGGTTKSRQSPLPAVKEMGNEFLYTHALSLWRGIEAEGHAFPANNISVAVSGFGDVEDGVQGIQGFLVPVVQAKNSIKTEVVKQSTPDVLGKRKREEDGIAKFLTRKEEFTPPLMERVKEDIMEGDEMETEDTYVCSKCHKHIPLQEMEQHEDYHVALELSKGSPIRAPPPAQVKAKPISKEEKKGPKKKTKPVEKGQRRLEFGM